MPTTGQLFGDGIAGNVAAGKTGIVYDWISEETEECGPDGTRITVTAQTNYSEAIRTNFAGDMVGYQANAAGNKISRVLPEPHPLKTWLWCTRCDLQSGIGRPNESGNKLEYLNAAGSPGKLRWTLTYEDPGYDIKSDGQITGPPPGELDRFVVRKSTANIEALPIEGTAWKWSSDDKVISERTTVPLTSVALEYTWHWVPEPLRESAWTSLLNKTNLNTFDTNYIAGTVLLTHYEKSERIKDARGTACRHITFFFLYRPTLWNNFYRIDGANGPDFYAVTSVTLDGGTPVRPFDLLTYDTIFTGGTS